jgi:pSer/pThr/pTyr-binding forkhead associated (FHA) protein
VKTKLVYLIAVLLICVNCVLAQDMTGGKILTETYIANLRELVGSDVIVKGIAGSVKSDPSNTGVYSLTDKFGKAIRVRAAHGNPPLAQTYLIHAIVNEQPGGEFELTELDRRKLANGLGVGPPETWTVVEGEPGSAPSDDAEPAEGEETESESSLPYLLLGAGAVLVIAAIAIGLSIKNANERRLRAEQERLAEMQRQEAQRQSDLHQLAAQPAPHVTDVLSVPVAPSGTMVSWGSLTVLAGPLKDAVFPLSHGAIQIGRTEGDITLETDQSVSSRHASILQSGDGTVYFEDHSTNGSFVNDRRLNNERVPLQTGDRIVIGPHTFEIKFSKAGLSAPAVPLSPGHGAATVVVPAQQAATVAFSGLQLVVEEGTDQGNAFPVNIPQTTIGRENRDVLLSDEHVSRQHAVILNQDGKWMLQNESNQGTTVLRFKRLV